MALNVKEGTEGLGPERRRQVEERAAEAIAEEMTLREQRHDVVELKVSYSRSLSL